MKKKREVEEIGLDEAYEKISRLYEENRFDEALREVNKIIKMYPHSPEPYIWLGDIEFEMSDIDKAVEAYKKAIRLDENNPVVHSSIARIYFLMGRFVDANRHIERALDINPEDAEAMYIKAILLDREGDFVLSDQYLKKANLLEPDSYPQPLSISRERFEIMMHMAFNNMPQNIRDFLGNILLLAEDVPSDNDLRLDISPLALSMLRVEGDKTDRRFNIVLFKRNLEHFSEDEYQLRDNIGICLLNEINKILNEIEGRKNEGK